MTNNQGYGDRSPAGEARDVKKLIHVVDGTLVKTTVARAE